MPFPCCLRKHEALCCPAHHGEPHHSHCQPYPSCPLERPFVEQFQDMVQIVVMLQDLNDQRYHDLLSTVEKMAEQLGRIVEQVHMLRQEEYPKPMERAEALHTLRSGKVIDNKVGSHEEKEATQEKEAVGEQMLQQQNEERRAAAGTTSGSGWRTPQPEVEETKQRTSETSKEEAVLPYPQRLGKAKRDKQFLELYFTLSKVQINLSLIEMIENVPLYAKFFKELCSKKRKLGAQEKIFC